MKFGETSFSQQPLVDLGHTRVGLRPQEINQTKVDQWLLRPVCNRATSKTKEIGVERSTLKLGQTWKIFLAEIEKVATRRVER